MREIIMTIGVATLLSACSTPWKSEYSCPGMPNGVVCKSPVEVYRLTERADHVTRDVEDAGAGDRTGEASKAAAANVFIPAKLASSQQLPREALPIREPAKLMRIWIAPYPDAKDDLHFPGLVVTEITPRRWSFGEATALKAKTLTPLQLDFQERTQRDSSGSAVEIGEEAKTLTPKGLVQGMQAPSNGVKSNPFQK